MLTVLSNKQHTCNRKPRQQHEHHHVRDSSIHKYHLSIAELGDPVISHQSRVKTQHLLRPTSIGSSADVPAPTPLSSALLLYPIWHTYLCHDLDNLLCHTLKPTHPRFQQLLRAQLERSIRQGFMRFAFKTFSVMLTPFAEYCPQHFPLNTPYLQLSGLCQRPRTTPIKYCWRNYTIKQPQATKQ